MDLDIAKVFAAGICIAVGGAASALAEGFIAGKAMETMGRNPSIKDELFTRMIVAMAIAESTAIYALVICFIILFAV